jgi:hypothetical protein
MLSNPTLPILTLCTLLAAITYWIGYRHAHARLDHTIHALHNENNALADQVDTLLDTVTAYRRHLDAVTAPQHPSRKLHLVHGDAS